MPFFFIKNQLTIYHIFDLSKTTICHLLLFLLQYMPETNDNTIVTGAGDYEVRVHNLVCKETTRVCVCHASRVKRLATAPDQREIFWSAAEDGIVRYLNYCLI